MIQNVIIRAKKMIFTALALALLPALFSCTSVKTYVIEPPYGMYGTDGLPTGTEDDAAAAETAQEPSEEIPEEIEPPAAAESIPEIAFSGKGIKIEAEDMLLTDCTVERDESASGSFCITMGGKESSASANVVLEAGEYECLISERAQDNAHSAIYVLAGTTEHKVFPSNPPLRKWELTTRSPITITVQETSTVSITLLCKSDDKGNGYGMSVDYVQLVKINEP